MSGIRTLLTVTFIVLMVFMLSPVFVTRAQTPGADQGTGTPAAMETPGAMVETPGATIETPGAMAETPGAATLGPAVSIRNQALQDNRLVIGAVRSDGPGWLVIHAATADGSVGPDIGHAALTSGENPHVVIPMENPGAVTESLFAMVHVDTGVIGVYEFPGPDVPAVADGKVLNFAFSITGGLPGGAPAATSGAVMETGTAPAAMETGAAPAAMETGTAPAALETATPAAMMEAGTPEMTATP